MPATSEPYNLNLKDQIKNISLKSGLKFNRGNQLAEDMKGKGIFNFNKFTSAPADTSE